MNWTEVNIYTASEGVDPVCGRLMNIGITGFAIKDSRDFEDFLNDKNGNWDYIDDDLMDLKSCETCVTFYLADNSQGADMLAMAKNEMAELAALDKDKKFGRLAVEISGVREEDWANNWKQYFKPIVSGKRLVVKPSWEDYDNKDNRIILEIDPGSSFGTGQHDTTRLCLEMLEKYLREGDKVLDLGCGSGILSIAALLLGADSACGADIDLNSVNIARENGEKNNIRREKYTLYQGNIIDNEDLRKKIGGGFGLITANIVADVLIAMSPLFGEFLADDGTVVISGIITERCGEVMKAMEEQGYELAELCRSNGWAAAAYRKGF